ncbi:hypothetical protein KZO58_02700 [Prevotella histicola]|uniref:hypothetical protein n=1 Tax=Prevotella histicola TaxID=470565 RepID=UPI001C5EC078|nr:hypothetical protein [Prevotella histicola]MBW4738436.1 hypothetical protein [Prevotella histicola]MBW4746912.1 hypothetical protein [Prevotella histicola]
MGQCSYGQRHAFSQEIETNGYLKHYVVQLYSNRFAYEIDYKYLTNEHIMENKSSSFTMVLRLSTCGAKA